MDFLRISGKNCEVYYISQPLGNDHYFDVSKKYRKYNK